MDRRRLAVDVGVGVVAALTGLFALGIVEARGEVGPGTVELQAGIDGSPRTSLEVPPLGRVSARTNRTPLSLTARVAELDVDRVQQLLRQPNPERALRAEAEDDLPALLRSFALRAGLTAIAAGLIVGAVVPGRRRAHLVIGAASALAATGVLLGITWQRFEPDAFAQPRFEGPLERAPQVVDAVQRQVGTFIALRDRVGQISQQLTGLYEVAISASAAESSGTEVQILHVSDIHLNPLGVEIIAELAREFDADAVLDTGDLTSFGLPLEARFGELLGAIEVPYLFVPGNHDSPENRAALGAVPIVQLLDGTTADIGGVEILGVGDPTFTATNEVATDEANLAKEASAAAVAELVESTQPDLLAVHDLRQAGEVAGRVRLVVAGHTHRRSQRVVDRTRFLTVGSTGATGLGSFTIDADVPYEAELLRFRAGRLVAVDYLEIDGVSGDFRLDREVLR